MNILEPATLALDAQGMPRSERYGDVYHSADSGPGQARHVFLGGNQLPERWRGRAAFTILETGFGLGLNFLSTWQAWRDDPARCARLHFVSVEKHPFTRESLAALHAAYPEFAPLSADLRAAWPMLVPGVHRMAFDEGRITLTLGLGDASVLIPKLHLVADALYLDGFAPAKNPDIWSPEILKAISRKAQLGTTVATYTAASAVRHALEREGFICELTRGFGRKRDMLVARYSPRWTPRHLRPAPTPPNERHALVIGAGLAGAAVSERLAARGWHIDLIDEGNGPASGASGLRAGAFHPHLSKDDCLLSRLSRNAFLLGLARWQALEAAGHAMQWARCGLLQQPHPHEDEAEMAHTLASSGFPAEYAQYIDATRASERAGVRVASGGWWIPQGGWLRAPTLVRALLAACGTNLTTHFGQRVHQVARASNASGTEPWQALRDDGSVIAEAPVLILANAHGVQHLAALGTRLKHIGGRLTHVATPKAMPRAVISGSGYAIPDGTHGIIAGSTYEIEEAPALDEASAHASNLARLAHLLPDTAVETPPSSHRGEYAQRAVAIDRMPLIGALPDIEAARAAANALSGVQLAGLPRFRGLYCATALGSRGITWSALAGEMLAAQIEGEPLPLEQDLADAIDPGRFALRTLRKGNPLR